MPMSEYPAGPCTRCGSAVEDGRCPRCTGGDEHGARLVALPTLRDGAARSSGPVRLVREYKGATVSDLLMRDEAVANRLPGELRGVLDAVREGNLAAAEQALDSALGRVLCGPGAARSRRRAAWFWVVVGLWFLMLATLLVLHSRGL